MDCRWPRELRALRSVRRMRTRRRHRGRDGVGLGPERLPTEDLLRCDRALRAPAAEEGDDPVGQHREAVLETGQPEQVDAEPEQPGEEARYPDASDGRDRLKTRDRRHCPKVAVPEWSLRRVAGWPSPDG